MNTVGKSSSYQLVAGLFVSVSLIVKKKTEINSALTDVVQCDAMMRRNSKIQKKHPQFIELIF